MSATTLPASPMVADPYVTPRPMVRRTVAHDGALIATVPNDGPRRRMADRLTEADRATIVVQCRNVGYAAASHPVTVAHDFTLYARQIGIGAIHCAPHDLRESERAWIDAVGGVAFLAAKLNAAGVQS